MLRLRIAAAALAAILISAGCGDTAVVPGTAPTAGSPTPPHGAAVTMALNFSPKTLDPTAGVAGWNTLQLGAGETLMRVNRSGNVEPWLAARVERSAEREWQITLRDGAQFFDGTPVDSRAVKASLERSIAKQPNLAMLLDAESVIATSTRTMTIITKQPNPALANALAHFGAVVHDADRAERDAASFSTSPNLTGAFKPADFRPDGGVRMVRNESYWGDKAKVAAVNVRFVVDAGSRTAAVLAGEVDLAYQVPPESLGAVRGRTQFTIKSVTTGYQYFIIFNTKKPALTDAAVRQAISTAIDREALARDVMLGTAKPATGAVSPIFPFALTGAHSPRDLGAVERQLDAAGWIKSADGVRVKGGERLSFQMLTYPQRPELGNLAVAIQDQLKKIGIQFSIRTVDQINTELGGSDWDASMYAVNTAPTGDASSLFNSYFKTGGGSNFGKFSSPAIDAAIDSYNRAEGAARTSLALDIQRQLNDQAPHAFLLVPQFNIALGARLSGYEPFPSDYYIVDNQLSVTR